MAAMRPPLLLLLQALTAVCSRSLVMMNSGVQVPRGRSVFITESELRVSVEPSADCKVEVVMNEPVTQRVGTLSPQVRPAHFSQPTASSSVELPALFSVCRCSTAASCRTR